MRDFIKYLIDVSKKWADVWDKEKVFIADPDPKRPKYFLTAAFMYPNGPAHLGHARTYLIPDIIARFLRALGFNVLFPMGFHYTGTPILATAERIASGDESYIERLAEAFALSKEDIAKLKEPIEVARYFHKLSKDAMRRYGLSIDWRREFTTIDPEFQAFIRWQFKKLMDKGYLIKGSHPVGWCPHHNMPVGMHDTKDDVEPEIDELFLIKFKDVASENFFVIATLRPETILGVTNIWVNPKGKYCLSEVSVEGGVEKWIISCEAARKLSFQKEVKVIKEFSGADLLDRKVINPITGSVVPVLEASFVSVKFGTGVVMSVPAHAPYDYVALREYVVKNFKGLWGSLKPIPLITVKGYSEVPAADIVQKLGILTQNDTELLDKATKELYRAEYDSGIMKVGLENLVVTEYIPGIKDFIATEISGKEVKIAREKIMKFLLNLKLGDVMYEVMNAPVYCRCGTEIVVKIVRDQWFIDYGNPEWKSKVLKALSNMRIIPEEARTQFVNTVHWLKAKACTRSRGLGTELPWAKGWVIESLSDSTIYMAFYTVIHKIREYGLNPDQLSEEFWDYVMLGLGDLTTLSNKLGIKPEVLKDIREEFTYWYPLDSRHSGKDLIPNHLTFFVFNHVAIFPEELWPKQIVANGWVLIKGEKMAKSKGNVYPIHWLIEKFSPDVVRFAIALGAEVEADLNLDIDLMESLAAKLKSIHDFITSFNEGSKELSDSIDLPERWLLSRFANNVLSASEDLRNFKIRSAGLKIFYSIHQDISEYLEMVEKPSKVLKDILRMWVIIMSPYTPFLAEELWHKLGNESLVVKEAWPDVRTLEKYVDVEAELSVEYLRRFIDDLKKLSEVVKSNEAVVYVAPENLYKHFVNIIDIVKSGGTLREVINYVVKNSLADHKQAYKVAKYLMESALSLSESILKSIKALTTFNEYELLMKFKEYIERKSGVTIKAIYKSDDQKAPDLGGKKSLAIPFRPSIYFITK